jgi:hypothetical protein
MSLCLLKVLKDEIFISADSRESKLINNQLFQFNDKSHKLDIIHDKCIFGGGSSELLEDILSEFANQNKTDIGTLYNIARPKIDKFKEDRPELVKQFNDMYCTLVIVEYSSLYKKPIVYFIEDYFDGVRYMFLSNDCPDDTSIYQTVGIKIDESKEIIDKNKDIYSDVKDLFQFVYDSLSYEGIGGAMTIYKVSENGIEKYFENAIQDSKEIICCNTVCCNATRVLGGRLLLTGDNWKNVSVAISGDNGINADTIKVGTLKAIDIDSVKITSSNISGNVILIGKINNF